PQIVRDTRLADGSQAPAPLSSIRTRLVLSVCRLLRRRIAERINRRLRSVPRAIRPGRSNFARTEPRGNGVGVGVPLRIGGAGRAGAFALVRYLRGMRPAGGADGSCGVRFVAGRRVVRKLSRRKTKCGFNYRRNTTSNGPTG